MESDLRQQYAKLDGLKWRVLGLGTQAPPL